MNVSIEAVAKSVKDALVVPVSAIFKSAEAGDYVVVAGADNKAHQTPVKIGIRTKQLAEIVSGLKEKASIIMTGGYGVPDGTKITIEAAPPAESEKSTGAGDDKKDEKSGADPAKEKD